MKSYFGSAALGGTVLVAALGCYMVSLKVSSERASVEALRRDISADVRDIRQLQAELRTRARLPELQRWNDNVLALSAPSPQQFVRDPVQLAAYAPGAVVNPPAIPAPLAPAAAAPAPRFAIAPAPSARGPVLQKISYPSHGATPAAPAAVAPAPVVKPAPSKPVTTAGLDAGLGAELAAAAAAESGPAVAADPKAAMR